MSRRTIYVTVGAAFAADFVGTETCAHRRGCSEANPLPGMQRTLGRAAYSVGGTVLLSELLHFGSPHYPKTAKAALVVVCVMKAFAAQEGVRMRISWGKAQRAARY